MKCFKLTDQNMRTYCGSFLWVLGEWAPTLRGLGPLCASGWYHAYDHALVAVLLNRVHADIRGPRLFEASYDGRSRTLDEHGLKRGVVSLRLDKEVPLPVITPEQRVRIAIYCARRVYHEDQSWMVWSNAWVDGRDRNPRTAESLPPLQSMGGAAQSAWAAVGSAAEMYNERACATYAARAVVYCAPLPDSRSGVNGFCALAERAIADENKFQEENTA